MNYHNYDSNIVCLTTHAKNDRLPQREWMLSSCMYTPHRPIERSDTKRDKQT